MYANVQVTYTADDEGFHPIVGAGPGGPSGIDPNALKSLVGQIRIFLRFKMS